MSTNQGEILQKGNPGNSGLCGSNHSFLQGEPIKDRLLKP